MVMPVPPLVTAYAETHALYAVLCGDPDEARRVLADMMPRERAEFAAQLDQLRAMLTDRLGNDILNARPAYLPAEGSS